MTATAKDEKLMLEEWKVKVDGPLLFGTTTHFRPRLMMTGKRLNSHSESPGPNGLTTTALERRATTMLSFNRTELNDLTAALRQEWLDVNGRGGYAASTVVDCHTRKYHGLLVAALSNPPGRFVMVSKLDPALKDGDRTIELGTNQYPGTLHPNGWHSLDRFEFSTFPSTEFVSGDIRLRRTTMMITDTNRVIQEFRLSGCDRPIPLQLRPFLACRGIHELTHENNELDGTMTAAVDHWSIQPYAALPPIYFSASTPMQFINDGSWYHNLEYQREQERGFDFQEDMYVPGCFTLQLDPAHPCYVACSLEPPPPELSTEWTAEFNRRQQALEKLHHANTNTDIALLKMNARKCVITNRRGERSIVAGYPWFVEWGRDTMIALPGLTTTCGEPDDAFAVLNAYANHEKDGLLPNYLADGDDGHHAYNSVDASLWYFRAVQLYVEATNNHAALTAKIAPCMERILTAYIDGRVPNAHLNDGLIWAGDAGTQLTWMDATAFGRPVTPRFGMAVEINALWYNALCFFLDWCQTANYSAPSRLHALRDRTGERFPRVFCVEGCEQIADVVNEHGADTAIRPNQLYAAALPYSPLSRRAQRALVASVRRTLVTPYGLRTLAPGSHGYVPRYEGDADRRDSAYHQGTVWPWLVGPYVDACLNTDVAPSACAKRLLDQFSPLWQSHLRDAGLYGISEIFDAEPPQRPNGCIQQAWSAAEVLRAWTRLSATT